MATKKEMSEPSPFASGGGGTVFEHRVGAWFLKELLLGRLGPLGGAVTAVRFQPVDAGPFDDLEVQSESRPGQTALAFVQVRQRQLLTANNNDFCTLLRYVHRETRARAGVIDEGLRGYVLAVNHRSPGWRSLQVLCRSAALHATSRSFVDEVARLRREIGDRLNQCRAALGSRVSDVQVHDTLRALSVQAFDLDDSTSEHTTRAVADLAGLWQPPNDTSAVSLFDRLCAVASERAPHGGTVDRDSLRAAIDDLPGIASLGSRHERLHELARAARGRAEGRLRALGVRDDLCERIADISLSRPPIAVPSDPVRVVIGEIGIGKSTTLDRLHLDAIEAALQDPNAPVPVHLDAISLRSSKLADVVASATSSLGGVAAFGVHVVVDGVDEAGLDAGRLAPDAYALVKQWPRSTVTLASRPERSFQRLPFVYLQPLSEEDAFELIELIAGGFGRIVTFARSELAQALRRPLYAILYGLRTGRPDSTSPAGLVAELGERSVSELVRRTGRGYGLLVRLAAMLIDNGGEPVDLRAIASDPPDRALLESSRLLRFDGDSATFQLAVLTEWFASRYLLGNPDALIDIGVDAARMHDWRYAAAQAAATGSERDVDNLMRILTTHAPASASWILHEATKSSLSGGRTIPTRRVLAAGKQLRDAMQTWLDALAPLHALVGPVDETGAQLPLGIAAQDAHVLTGWDTGVERAVPIVRLPREVHPLLSQTLPPRWIGLRSGPLSRSPTWAWDWALELLRPQIDSVLASGRLEASVDVLAPELAWAYALAIVGQNELSRGAPIRLKDLETAIEHVVTQWPDAVDITVKNAGQTWRVSEGRRLVEFLQAEGADSVAPPWPRPDSTGSWTWDFWSTELLLDRLNLVTRAALDAYEAIVDRWFPKLKFELATSQLLPVRVVGELYPGTRDGSFAGQPMFHWYVEPTEEGHNSAVWTIAEKPTALDVDWGRLRAKIELLRPNVGDSNPLKVHNGDMGIFSVTPASQMARSLLVDDLRRFYLTLRHAHSTGTRLRPPSSV